MAYTAGHRQSTASTSASPLPQASATTADAHGSDDERRPAKRVKTRACLRCRRRKQRCDNQRPCSNCAKAGEHCATDTAAPPPPPPQPHTSMSTTNRVDGGHDPGASPLGSLTGLASLEARILRIEQAVPWSGSRHSRMGSVPPEVPQPGVAESLTAAAASPCGLGNNIVSPSRSTPAVALLSTFATAAPEQASLAAGAEALHIDHDTEDNLFRIYDAEVQWRYPFLRLHQLRFRSRRPSGPCTTFFVTMICAIGLLLQKSQDGPAVVPGHKHQDFYRLAVTRHLAHIFNQPDRLLHVQAYLILAMHALYSPSTERIITLSSAAMRYCVMAQLHCSAAEPEPADVAARILIQMRRRIFWCAYKLDRTVGGIYHLPFAVPDSQITVKLYANIDDADLEQLCRDAPAGGDVRGVSRLTDVSAALHVVYCRQIQSEILNFTLHRDYGDHHSRQDRWRRRVLDKLDRWRSLWGRYYMDKSPSAHRSNLASNDWINMMYSYSLGMLYQPTKTSVYTSAGAWTVKACVQACLIFRQFQRETYITELWLGLVTQFKCGIALLYTLFATQPSLRPSVYHHPDVSEAVRACSITLALIAERWPQSRCTRDTFDIIAREVPLSEYNSAGTRPRRIRDESRSALLILLKRLEPIIVHRDTLRMIHEIATEEFPSSDEVPAYPSADRGQQQRQRQRQEQEQEQQQQRDCLSPSRQTEFPEDMFQPVSPSGLYLDMIGLEEESLGDTAVEFPAYLESLGFADAFTI